MELSKSFYGWAIATGVLGLACAGVLAWPSQQGPTDSIVGGIRVTRSVPIATEAGAERPSLDIAIPKGEGPFPVVVFFAGGAWMYDGGAYRSEVVEAARRGYVGVRLNYRLLNFGTGEGAFPAQLEDARSAVNWLQQEHQQFKADVSRLAFVGKSAGGHLALLAGLRYPELGVDAIVSSSAPIDLAAAYAVPGSHRELLESYLGGTAQERPDQFHDASPINFVSEDSPPTLHFHGEADNRVPVEMAQLLKSRWAEVGGEHEVRLLPGEGHQFSAALMESIQLQTFEFLAAHLAPQTRATAQAHSGQASKGTPK